MAAFLHLSENTVSNYLAGRTHIPFPTMLAWAHFTGVDLAWLIDDDYDPDDDGEVTIKTDE
jgi:transcriptional regulator with XRE-family HTH domain